MVRHYMLSSEDLAGLVRGQRPFQHLAGDVVQKRKDSPLVYLWNRLQSVGIG
jgi:hypothetical protein